MTTAARPTFDPARGGQGRSEKDLSAISKQYSSRDLPSHTKLKFREYGQGTTEELRSRDFRKELEDREKGATRDGKRAVEPRETTTSSSGGGGGSGGSGGGSVARRPRPDQVPAASLDADDPLDGDDSGEEEDEGEEEEDTAALLAELQRIKKERAAEQARREVERRQEEERIRMENILSGNPLLHHYAPQASKPDLKVKRRWDDDVVFKNCARSEPEKKKERFINDSLRSEFHRKFMEKYVK
ncbi:spliceosome-associated protein CWC15 homolog isoform X2 [Hetaerina americana]|uniref:spliceosome-associated protein CWC15 homolog isoform X2 n=1 Tax=Hetaerina americana TaxID=62018 RepID=UPI003A7F23B3